MNISGSFIFSIKDSQLDFDSIKTNLLLRPSKIIRKGDTVGILENHKALVDSWFYEIKINDEKDIFTELSNLLIQLEPYSDYISIISNKYQSVAIDCYIRSSLSQFGFSIDRALLKKITNLSSSLNFHIISYGDETD